MTSNEPSDPDESSEPVDPIFEITSDPPERRRRGRPPKEPLVTGKVKKEKEKSKMKFTAKAKAKAKAKAAPVIDDDDDPDDVSDDDGDVSRKQSEQHHRVILMGQIRDLKKKLNAVGTGLVPSNDCSTADLEAEVELLNQEINGRRGDQVMKALTIQVAGAMPTVLNTLQVDKNTLDLTGLDEEVEANYDVLEEAATQLAIMHASLFNITKGPFAAYAQGMFLLARSRNMKNQAERRRARAMYGDPADDDDEDIPNFSYQPTDELRQE